MTWAERLLRFATGDRKPEVLDHLAAFQRGVLALAQALEAAGREAPNVGAEGDLSALATAARALVTAMTDALQARGSSLAPVPPPVLNGAARNHWARLVNALEACRELLGRVERTTPRLLELEPELAEPLRGLSAGLHTQLLGLRALIARADPQALD
jgi:hypothetical protein